MDTYLRPYIYIYRERERDRQTGTKRERQREGERVRPIYRDRERAERHTESQVYKETEIEKTR